MEEDDFQDEDGLKGALEEAEADLQAAYRKVWPLRERYAEMFPSAELPARRYRTAKQDLVARCPRCGGKLPKEEQLDDIDPQ